MVSRIIKKSIRKSIKMNKVSQAALSGGFGLVVGGSVMYLISGGKYPNRDTFKYFLPA
jgi:hypothetical protein